MIRLTIGYEIFQSLISSPGIIARLNKTSVRIGDLRVPTLQITSNKVWYEQMLAGDAQGQRVR